jgi:hypothetical protein
MGKMAQRSSGGVSRGFRTGRGVGGTRHDPYRDDAKREGPAYCSSCGATYRRGRWTWLARPADAVAKRCPACRRISEQQPGGVVSIPARAAPSRGELLHLIRNAEQRERARHPLERLMSLRRAGGELLIETTGPHAARSIASAVARTMHCELAHEFLHDQDLVRFRLVARKRPTLRGRTRRPG